MKNKDIEKLENKIHSLDISELKDLVKNSTPIKVKVENQIPKENYTKMELEIQDLSIKELKNLSQNGKPVQLESLPPSFSKSTSSLIPSKNRIQK